jgi:hypothetical protein
MTLFGPQDILLPAGVDIAFDGRVHHSLLWIYVNIYRHCGAV